MGEDGVLVGRVFKALEGTIDLQATYDACVLTDLIHILEFDALFQLVEGDDHRL
jgi:hypothetical protein